MVSPICKAKDPSTCPYHSALRRMFVVEQKVIDYRGQEALPMQLFNEYVEAKNAVEEFQRRGWTEEDYAGAITEKVGAPPVREQPQNLPAGPPVKVEALLNGERIKFVRGDQYDMDKVPTYVRFHASRSLSRTQKANYTSLLNYAFKQACVRGKATLPVAVSDSNNSFIVPVTGFNRSDVKQGLTEFAQLLRKYEKEGTPPRPTQNNTRKVSGIPEDERPQFRLYFSSQE